MIKINKEWYIDSDKRCYILCKKAKRIDKDTGEKIIYFTDKTFHPTVSAALSAFIRKMHLKEVYEYDMTLNRAIKQFSELEYIILKSTNNTEI